MPFSSEGKTALLIGLIHLIAILGVPGLLPPVSAVCAPLEPDFFMEAEPGFLAMAKGDTKTSIITLTSIDGFDDQVVLEASSDEPLVLPDLDKTSVNVSPNSAGVATLTISTDPNVPFGFHSVTVVGDPLGLGNSVVVSVVVPAPDFSLDSNPSSLTLDPVDSKTSTITVTSENGFVGTVSLSTEITPPPDIPPSALAASLSVPGVTLVSGETEPVVLIVTSTSSTPAGFYTVKITGTSGPPEDPLEHSESVGVTVRSPGFSMSATPFVLELLPGGQADTSTVTVESVLGFSGIVSLGVFPPPPPGVNAELNKESVDVGPGAAGTATLTVSVDSSYALFPFVLIHVAGSSGDKFGAAFVSVVILLPDIEVTANPESLPLQSGTSAITVKSLYGFEGTVNLEATPSDPCVEVALPTSVIVPKDGLAMSTLSITVDPNTPPGIYDVNIIGIVPGSFFAGDDAVVTLGEPPNEPPVAIDDSYSTAEDTPLSVSAPGVLGNDSDPEDDPLTAEIVTGPSSGTLALNDDGSFTYTPVANFIGTVTFTYRASDSSKSDGAMVTISVTTVNDAPVAADDSYSTAEDTVLTVTAPGVLNNDADADGTSLTAELVTNPSSGTLTLNADGSFTYAPNANFRGDDGFTYRASDGSLTDEAIVTISVTSVNDAPVANFDSYSATRDIPLSRAAPGVLGNDLDDDGDPLTAALVDGPTTGTLTLNPDGSFTYTPALGFTGTATFTYSASDGSLTSNVATVTIIVIEANRPPALSPIGNKPVNEGSPLTFIITAEDPDAGQILAFSASNVPGATFNPISRRFSWTPSEAQGPGTFTVTFTVTDDGTPPLSDSETITITVNEVNQAPVLPSLATRTVTQGSQLTFAITATDADIPHTLTYSLDPGAPTGASITGSGGVFSWTPAANQEPGTYTITVRVTDGAASDTESFTVTVSAPQQAPPAPRPFWEEYWYVLLIVILVLAGIPVAVKVRGKPRPKN